MLLTWAHGIAHYELNVLGSSRREKNTLKCSILVVIKSTHLELLMWSLAGLQYTFPLPVKMCVMSKLVVLAQLSLVKHLKPGRHSQYLQENIKRILKDFVCP